MMFSFPSPSDPRTPDPEAWRSSPEASSSASSSPPPGLSPDPEGSYRPESPVWEAWVVSETYAPDEGETKAMGSGAVPCDGIGSETLAERGGEDRLPYLAGGGGASDASLGRFRMHRKIAEGGFGEVWEATQRSLGRTVAVKRLKVRPAHPPEEESLPTEGLSANTEALVSDFRLEALITAQLEHPNIIPVYDLGVDGAGLPLLAMKRIQGRLWSDVLREDFRSMRVEDFLAKHLQILIQVTQAVAFAHSHRILHRDLKPLQVMIGRFGEALLMDWGLAMAYGTPEELALALPTLPLDPNSPLFDPVNPAGTPAFMAPEQTEKTSKNLGPWTDVYLLGGILYRLLTGRNPHVGVDSETTFRQAHRGIVPPPEERAPEREIPPQLARLAMRAMEKNPSHRIESAEALLAELQDYLTGAGQRRESARTYREVRTALRKAGNTYVELADALNQLDRALTLWPANAEATRLREQVLVRYAQVALDSQDLKLARLQAERLTAAPERDALLAEVRRKEETQRKQQEELDAAYRQARIDRDRAEEARQRAEQMRIRSETLVSFLIGDLHQALQAIGRLDLLRRVTQKSLEYFDSLPAVEATPQNLHNRAIAYLNIGKVFTDEGKKPDALDAFRKARDIARILLDLDPENAAWQTTLADSHDKIGQILYYQGQMDEALEQHRAAMAIRERLATLHPDDPAVRQGIASCLHKTGIIAWRRQELDRALDLHEQSLAILRRLVEQAPDDRLVATALSWTLSTLGNVHRDRGDLERSIALTREALAIRESLMHLEPANIARSDDFLWTQGNLALLHLFEGDHEKSIALFLEYMPLRRRLLMEDPNNVVRTTAVTFPLSLMGESYYVLRRFDEAEAVLRECLELTSALYARDPTSTHTISAHARLHAQLADVHVAQARWDEAEALAEIAYASALAARERTPKSVMTLKVFATASILRGRLLARNGHRDEARAVWQRAADAFATIQIQGDEVDILDLNTQLDLLLGRERDFAAAFERLHAKRWITPTLAGVCRETGHPLPEAEKT